MKRIDEHDELLLNRLVDGDLPAEEAAALRGRIEREPELRSVYESLVRLNALLAERRKDACAVNWGRFHAAVMSRIEADAARPARLIRFPFWVRVAAPLAAAAAVALVVVLRTPHGTIQPAPAAQGTIRVAYQMPRAALQGGHGALVVRFSRPGQVRPANAGPSGPAIQVAYARSVDLEDSIRRADQARQNEPSSHLYIMHADRSAPVPADVMEAAPLWGG
jgi:anti-sigma factor RsiW